MRKYNGTMKLFGVKFNKELTGTGQLVGWIIMMFVVLALAAAIGYFLIAGAWYILNMIFGWGLWSWQSSFGIWLICVILKFFFNNVSE